MRSKEKKMNKFYMSLIIIFFVTSSAFAKTGTSNAKKLELINIVNQQQILSQRITKAYLYVKKTNVSGKADRQLKSALKHFYQTYSKINTSTKSTQIRSIMSFIKKSSIKFNTLTKQPHSKKNTKEILKLSETVLAKSKKVATLLKKDLNKNIYESLEKSNQQQVLAEKIATYYKALQSNKNDAVLKKKIRVTIAAFATNHRKLMHNKQNSKIISKKLKEVDKLWKAAYQIFQDKKLTSIVFGSTTEISKKMKEVSKLYMAMKQ